MRRFTHAPAPAGGQEPTTECGSKTPDAGRTSARAASCIRSGQMVAKNDGMFPRRSAANFACLPRNRNSMLQSHSKYAVSCVRAHRHGEQKRERQVLWLPVQMRPHARSEEHTSELQSLTNLVCRLLLEKKNTP